MNYLAHYRRTNKLTQQQLAAEVHINQNHISMLETGYQLPWPYEARALATFFGVKVDAIFPDGLREKANYGRRFQMTEETAPPVPMARIVGRLDRCPKCGVQAIFDNCYACGHDLLIEALDSSFTPASAEVNPTLGG